MKKKPTHGQQLYALRSLLAIRTRDYEEADQQRIYWLKMACDLQKELAGLEPTITKLEREAQALNGAVNVACKQRDDARRTVRDLQRELNNIPSWCLWLAGFSKDVHATLENLFIRMGV